MARPDTVERTPATDDASPVDADVVVVGGGTAGLSAAVFLARYGLETLVLARGKSAIEQCALLENYLGFPGGITPQRFLALARSQAEFEGATVRSELVASVHPDGDLSVSPGGFRVESDAETYRTQYVLAGTAYDGDPFDPVEDRLDTDATYGKLSTDAGRTGIEGLYAAGWMTDETVHQAVVNAGHGARAAIRLVRDDLSARYWPAVAEQYVDWVVHDGRYGGEDWTEHTAEWFEDDILPSDRAVDDDRAAEALAHLRSEFLDRQLTEEERRRRDREGQRRLLDQLDDEVIREYADALGAEQA